MMAVFTVTLNPAIDQTVMLDRLVPGEVHRACSIRQDAGGKGINAASCLADWDVPVTVLGLLGGANAAPFDVLFAAKSIIDRCQRHAGSTRVNLKLVDPHGTTDINMDGVAATGASIDAVIATLDEQVGAGDLVILSGSLPPGCPADIYASLTAMLQRRGATILLDSSGPALRHALAGPVLPTVLKPNLHELAEWHGGPIDAPHQIVDVAHKLLDRGVDLIAVSMGAQGALFLTRSEALRARLTAQSVESTVGAGDAMVAGLAAALIEGAGLDRIARLSTAFAVGKLGCAGPHLPARNEIEALAACVETDILMGETR
ncbi:1-phosphofructokinase family hexose kinase [Sphingobium sp. TB-6]|uniref:1-phosphofructokinase family hexose kinase n=1 Tax=Sphingobium sp. TB-6 TaxID=2728850 RepID=UPI001F0F9158|nr:1-phosphofructokinase family hexose kinase [Sphingobium sp. TB-6]